MARYDLGTPLWVPNMQNAPLGNLLRNTSTTNPNAGVIWRWANELSGPGGFSTQVVQEAGVQGVTGPRCIKSTLDLRPTSEGGTGTKAGIRHFEEPFINNNSQWMMETWHYVPQVITSVGHGVMLAQAKQNTNRWMGSWWYSHANVGISLFNRNGQNFVRVGVLDVFWRSGGGVKWLNHPTKNIPINQWFGLRVRYTKSSPGVPNGRWEAWQIDIDGTVTLIADHQNVITWWDRDADNISAINFSGEMLRAGFGWYAENTFPRIITNYHDRVGIYLPADISTIQAPQGTVTTSTATNITQTSGSIPWSYSSNDATSYQYRVNGGAVLTFSGNPLVLTGLQPSTIYTVEIRAVNSSGVGNWSSPRSFTTLAVPPHPDPEEPPVPPTDPAPVYNTPFPAVRGNFKSNIKKKL